MLIKGKTLEIPIIQGGMGVGVSLSNLAGAVAKCGGLGVISSVNAGYRDEGFLEQPKKTNLMALAREIKRAKEIAGGKGLVGVNIMTAVSHYEETCQAAVEAGADVIISGAGLPLKLPEFTKKTNTLCCPIVSSARALKLIMRQYQRNYDCLPDMVVIEGAKAGGHLGFSNEELVEGNYKSNEDILIEVLAELKNWEGGADIPVFVGGGVFDGKDMARMMQLGASGVQIGTRMIATKECDASDAFKQAIVDAKTEDIKIIKSPVGMPARAIYSPLIKRIEKGEQFLPIRCNGCLTGCKKNNEIPYCISRALIAAVTGDYENGLFFTGSNGDRIDKIVTVQELIDEIMGEYQLAMAN